MRLTFLVAALAFIGFRAQAANQGDYLVKVAPTMMTQTELNLQARLPAGSQIEDLGIAGWIHVTVPQGQMTTLSHEMILRQPGVLSVQPDRIIKLQANWTVKDAAKRAALMKRIQDGLPIPGDDVPADNPAIPTSGSGGSGPDPLVSHQWNMRSIGVQEGWKQTKGNRDMIVAVIDTGVDYTHEDLVDNIWHNPGEMGTDAQGHDKSSNAIDDDNNGYVDDVIGWDFSGNDNKPYDLKASTMDMLFNGGNPGHGTHCAGNVGARSDNGKGIAGVAPNVRIMPVRFISQKGQGTTADAIKAIKYAVDNGAKVLSNSWGSEGDDPSDPSTQALHDAITYAQQHGVLFVAAAGNGHQGVGYNNDTDSKPGVPASYDNANIISVAAVDSSDNLASFSNWGVKTVDLGAPGVKIFSTTVGNNYSDTVINMPKLGIVATWDGTSMATPHVAGAAALYWSAHPNATWEEVKSALLSSVKRTSALSGKVSSGGQLDVANLMSH